MKCSFFGAMMIGAEVPCNFMLKRFLFIKGFFGRGIFYILYFLFSVGTLCIRYNTIFQFVVAAFLIVIGIVYIFTSCSSCSRSHEADANKEVKRPETELQQG